MKNKEKQRQKAKEIIEDIIELKKALKKINNYHYTLKKNVENIEKQIDKLYDDLKKIDQDLIDFTPLNIFFL